MHASLEKMEKVFSSDELGNLAPSSEGDVYNRAVVREALTDASNEIDSYLAGRYPNPLPTVPTAIERAACDIARYFLYKDAPTEHVSTRYKEVIAWLRDVARGLVVLVFDPPLTPVEVVVLGLPVSGVNTGGVFSDARLSFQPNIIETDFLPWPQRS